MIEICVNSIKRRDFVSSFSTEWFENKKASNFELLTRNEDGYDFECFS